MATATPITTTTTNLNDGPQIEFVVNATGMTIFSAHFNTPRYVPWDMPGRCTRCKSTTVEVDYVLQPNGVSIICNRLKQQVYLPFDEGAKWTDGSRIRIRSRNKVLTIPLQMDGMQSNDAGQVHYLEPAAYEEVQSTSMAQGVVQQQQQQPSQYNQPHITNFTPNY